MKGDKNIELGGEKKVEEKENVGGGEEEAELRPQLPPGFYEVEAVRRKRVRKGEVQYYIKWRGWPESTNTWEPLDNLETCLDIVDAFEKSSRKGKQRPPQKRKNRSGCPVHQAKEKQHRTPAMASPVMGGVGMGKWTDDTTEEEEENEQKEVPYVAPVEIAARKIKEFKRKQEEKRKEELEAQARVARQTRSARKTAMGQPIGVQFHNTNDNPVIIDDAEEIRSFTVRGVTLTALTYYKNGKHCVPTQGLIEAIDKKLPSVNEEQRKALEEEKRELVKKLEAKAERRGKGLGS